MGSLRHLVSIGQSVLALIAVAASPVEIQAQSSFRVERSRLLPVNMSVKKIGPFRSTNLGPAPGRVWTQKVPPNPTGDAAIRVHVRVVAAQIRSPWSVRVKDANGNDIERFSSSSALASAGEFWTDEVPGDRAVVELWAEGDPAGLTIEVDEYAFRVTAAQPQAITGQDQRIKDIRNAPAKVRGWAPAVARLRFVIAGGGQAFCTAFLVGANLLMTNQHCISSPEEARSAVADFGYDSPAAQPDRYHVVSLLASHPGLDYSLLLLEGTPSAKYRRLFFEQTNGVADAGALVIVEHGAGDPKQASVEDCRVDGLRRPGVGGDASDFGHQCDTEGGSSGSPVLDWNTGHVVGLHHLGFRLGVDEPVNQAVLVSPILQELQKQVTATTYRELTQLPPP